MLGQMMARAILNNIPLGLHLAEYISKYIMDEQKNVMQDFETTDKNLFNSINNIDPEVIFSINDILMKFSLTDKCSSHEFMHFILLFPCSKQILPVRLTRPICKNISPDRSSKITKFRMKRTL